LEGRPYTLPPFPPRSTFYDGRPLLDVLRSAWARLDPGTAACAVVEEMYVGYDGKPSVAHVEIRDLFGDRLDYVRAD